MRKQVRRTSYGDEKINQLARDVQGGFDAILDLTRHKVTVVWNPPYFLSMPFFDGTPRQVSPDVILCPKAKNLTDSTILVTPAGCSFEWVGGGQARIDAVGGLTVGDKYELVFWAVG